MARSSYESRLAKAAEEDDFKAFQAAYRERDKWRDGRGTINGDLARDVVGTPEQVAASNPIGVAPGNRAVVAPDTLAVRASMDKNFQNVAQKREDAEEASRMRYQSFLADMGINPNEMSGMQYASRDGQPILNDAGNRIVQLPTQAEKDFALKNEAQRSREHSRFTRLANQAKRRGDSIAQARLLDVAEEVAPMSDDIVRQRNTWINRFLAPNRTAYAYRNKGNGY